MSNIKTIILLATLHYAYTAFCQEARVTFHVKDEFGKPVMGAQMRVTVVPGDPIPSPGSNGNGSKIITGIVDSNGVYVFQSQVNPLKFGELAIPGYDLYYNVHPQTNFYLGHPPPFHLTNHTATRWEPWDPSLELVLRPIMNPIPMYARRLNCTIPQPTNTYGFDLQVGDWIAPDGKGLVADILFQVTGRATSVQDNDSRLKVSFPNPMDGIQSFVPMTNSAFVSPRTAPTDGYQPLLTFRRTRLPGQRSSQWYDDNQHPTNYIFRVRTVVDDQGNIKSVLYGKIQGGISFGGAVPLCNLTLKNYYLNPTPNDRNLEFDPKRNLASDVKRGDEVRDP